MLTSIVPTASAQTLPEGRRTTIGTETYQCYDLDEYKTLLQVESELLYLRVRNYELGNTIALKDDSIRLYQNLVDTQADSIKVLSDDHSRIYKLWSAENQKRHEAENKPSFNGVAWTLVAVFAATTGVLLLDRAAE